MNEACSIIGLLQVKKRGRQMVLSLGTLEFLKNYVTTTWFKNIYIFFLDSKLCLIVSFQQVNPLQHGSAKVLGIQQCSG